LRNNHSRTILLREGGKFQKWSSRDRAQPEILGWTESMLRDRKDNQLAIENTTRKKVRNGLGGLQGAGKEHYGHCGQMPEGAKEESEADLGTGSETIGTGESRQGRPVSVTGGSCGPGAGS